MFVRSGGEWSQQAYLKASNTGATDSFGRSISLSGETLAVGAIGEDSAARGVNSDQSDDSASYGGAVYVFVRSGRMWSQQAYVKASNTGEYDRFGSGVAIFEDTLAVGAYNEDSAATGVDGDETNDSAADSGAVYVFARSAGEWSQQAYLKASNTGEGDTFGRVLALSGDTLAVGAHGESSAATGVNGDPNDDSAFQSGAVYVFVRSEGEWIQRAYLKASNAEAGDWFGDSVSLSGDTLAVGAFREDSAATGVNGDRSDNSAPNSGAVEVLRIAP